jgi:hypothetical protein
VRWVPTAALLLAAGCACPHDGRTGNVSVDACLHWTACTTPPPAAPSSAGLTLASCEMLVTGYPLFPLRLPWAGEAIAITPAQLSCIAEAGLDCDRALDCVSTPAPTPCPSPTWWCDGDTLRRCDAFRGDRVISEDCAAEGMRCVPVGSGARCGLAVCDVGTIAADCLDNRVVSCIGYTFSDGTSGGVVTPREDCGDHDATCAIGPNGAECVGNGAPCTPFPGGGLACDGDVLVGCENGYETRLDCAASGLHCVTLTGSVPGAGRIVCARQPEIVICGVIDFYACQGTTLYYCDENGNQSLDCKCLGYRDCSDGHCVP